MQTTITESDYTPPGSSKKFRKIEITREGSVTERFYAQLHEGDEYAHPRQATNRGVDGPTLSPSMRPVRIAELASTCLAWLEAKGL